MNLEGIVAGFWRNLSVDERHWMTAFNRRQVQWLSHLEVSRKNKTPIDYSLEVSDESYFKADKLRNKFFQPYTGKGSIHDWSIGY